MSAGEWTVASSLESLYILPGLISTLVVRATREKESVLRVLRSQPESHARTVSTEEMRDRPRTAITEGECAVPMAAHGNAPKSKRVASFHAARIPHCSKSCQCLTFLPIPSQSAVDYIKYTPAEHADYDDGCGAYQRF